VAVEGVVDLSQGNKMNKNHKSETKNIKLYNRIKFAILFRANISANYDGVLHARSLDVPESHSDLVFSLLSSSEQRTISYEQTVGSLTLFE